MKQEISEDTRAFQGKLQGFVLVKSTSTFKNYHSTAYAVRKKKKLFFCFYLIIFFSLPAIITVVPSPHCFSLILTFYIKYFINPP